MVVVLLPDLLVSPEMALMIGWARMECEGLTTAGSQTAGSRKRSLILFLSLSLFLSRALALCASLSSALFAPMAYKDIFCRVDREIGMAGRRKMIFTYNLSRCRRSEMMERDPPPARTGRRVLCDSSS